MASGHWGRGRAVYTIGCLPYSVVEIKPFTFLLRDPYNTSRRPRRVINKLTNGVYAGGALLEEQKGIERDEEGRGEMREGRR